MIVFGKKCPQCGKTALKKQENSTAGREKNGRYLCDICHRSIRYRWPCSFDDDQRREPRHALPTKFLMRIHDTQPHYGRITNISRGGVGFLCKADTDLSPGALLEVDLYNCENGRSLEKLPAKIVSTKIQGNKEVQDSRQSRRSSASFLELNDDQQELLDLCIKEHGRRLDSLPTPR
ncbi:MAG: hypothetical protein CSA34_01805 [Desulfobulbus propionicus]|nr:MAG: hypothetical protein CSA34_01805 [Desulfobulbus propionicus]